MRKRQRLRSQSGLAVWVGLGALLSFGPGCAETGAAHAGKPAGKSQTGAAGGHVGDPLPAIVVRTIKGSRTIDLGEMKGKVILLDIWASWCGPCKEEMPLLDDMAARLKPKGIEVLAVSIDEEKAAAESFLQSRGRWTLTVAHDPKGEVAEVMQPPKMPTSYIFDGRGILRYVNAGFERADAKRIEDRLLALAAEGT